MNRLIKSATALWAFTAAVGVATSASASTFTASYDVGITGSVGVDSSISPFLPLLGLDVPETVDIAGSSTGSFSVDSSRFLDGDLTFGLSDLEPTLASLETAYLDSFLAGLGLSSTSSLVAQLDDVFDYTLSGTGSFTSASANETFAINYDSDINELTVDGFDATSCLTETCSGNSVVDFSLEVNLAAFGTFVDSLSGLALSTDVQATLTTVQTYLPLLPFEELTLISGELSSDFTFTPISLLPGGNPEDYALIVEMGELLITEPGAETPLVEVELSEPVAYGTPSSENWGDETSEGSTSVTSASEGSETDDTGSSTTPDEVVTLVAVDPSPAASVPEPGLVVGLLTVGGLAWRKRQA